MSSRKKVRGRQNRAKKEATRTVEQRLLWEPIVLHRNHGVVAVPCEHTLVATPQIPLEGSVVTFMNHLAGEGFFNKATQFRIEPVMKTCHDAVSLRLPGVRKEDSERALAIDLLQRFLRNSFVQDSKLEEEKWFHQCHENEAAICCMIYLLELLGTYSDMIVVRRRAAKMGNKLVGGNRRDVVKFVVKRLPCTCLKDLHRAARKKVAKVGQCHNCARRIPRSQLHVCKGCMMVEYCCRECQRADWKDHKQFCGNPEVMSRFLHSDYVFKRS